MAIYTMQVKTISRSNGHSATAKIAYNCRDKITDLRTGEIHKYNSKKMAEDLVYSEITSLLPLLSKFLGHRHINETEYYLRFTEENYDSVKALTNNIYQGVFPKVEQ